MGAIFRFSRTSRPHNPTPLDESPVPIGRSDITLRFDPFSIFFFAIRTAIRPRFGSWKALRSQHPSGGDFGAQKRTFVSKIFLAWRIQIGKNPVSP